MRLFVAVALPPAVKDELARVIERLRPAMPDAKWVPRDNIHLTLVFLGEVPEDRVGPIEAALGRVASDHQRLRTRLADAGAFPSARRARVLWVGLEDDGARLASLAAGCARVLEPLGFTPEARPWTPHVTLARLRTPGDARPLLPPSMKPVAFTVRDVTLFRSRLGRPAPRYEPVSRAPLAR